MRTDGLERMAAHTAKFSMLSLAMFTLDTSNWSYTKGPAPRNIPTPGAAATRNLTCTKFYLTRLKGSRTTLAWLASFGIFRSGHAAEVPLARESSALKLSTARACHPALSGKSRYMSNFLCDSSAGMGLTESRARSHLAVAQPN
jgi:hypothetical protein